MKLNARQEKKKTSLSEPARQALGNKTNDIRCLVC